jgi:hypothetical protein
MEEPLTADSIEARLLSAEAQLAIIAERNRKVELEKAWETSAARVICVGAITFALMTFIFYVIEIPHYLISGAISAVGYYLSTLTLPIFKRVWIIRQRKP